MHNYSSFYSQRDLVASNEILIISFNYLTIAQGQYLVLINGNRTNWKSTRPAPVYTNIFVNTQYTNNSWFV